MIHGAQSALLRIPSGPYTTRGSLRVLSVPLSHSREIRNASGRGSSHTRQTFFEPRDCRVGTIAGTPGCGTDLYGTAYGLPASVVLELCQALDNELLPKNIEGTRAKLKRLVELDVLTEADTGSFARKQ